MVEENMKSRWRNEEEERRLGGRGGDEEKEMSYRPRNRSETLLFRQFENVICDRLEITCLKLITYYKSVGLIQLVQVM